MNANTVKVTVLLLIVAAFVAGLVSLVQLRFEQGNAYPRYSSLRADPQGCKALYDSLSQINGLKVSRNFKSLKRLDLGKNSTFLLLGLNHSALEYVGGVEDTSLLDRIAEGNRLVLTSLDQSRPRDLPEFFEDWEAPEEDGEDSTEDTEASKEETDTAGDNDEALTPEDEVPPFEWDEADDTDYEHSVAYQKVQLLFSNDTTESTEALAYFPLGLPDSIPWRESQILTDYDEKWRIIYQVDEHPVILERPYGKGSIVLLTDSYLLSNEALLKNRETALLSWILGDSTQIIFNESHLGVHQPTGIAVLMKQYKLGGFALGLGFVVLLLIWKNSQALIPPQKTRQNDDSIRHTDRNLQSGYRDLLVRCLPLHDLVTTCISEWKQSLTPKQRNDPTTKKINTAIDQAVGTHAAQSKRKQNTVTLYRTIHKIIHQTKEES